jgi:Fibronectin type III domain
LNASSGIYSKNNLNKEDYVMRIHRFPCLPRQVFSLMIFVFLLALVGTIGTSVFLSPPAAEAQGSPKGFLHRNDPLVREAIEVQNRHIGNLMRIPDVVGTGVGMGPDGLPVIKVFTARHGVPGIPEWLESVPVQAEVTGIIVALGACPSGYCGRPSPIGVSTGHPAITAGTIGCRVTDGTNVYALSNNHVYANSNNASLGDSALQPGPYDGGQDTDYYRIGTLYDFQPINFSVLGSNTIDAAIALTTPDYLGTATLQGGYGTPSSVPVEAAVELSVKKYGRTTLLTHGQVSEINVTITVCYANCSNPFRAKLAWFDDQIGITNVGAGSFSLGGDSGSLIVTEVGNNPVGLLFAGSDTKTFANRIDLVLERFGVTIDDGTGQTPEPPAAPSGLTATAISDRQINLVWADNSDNETGFKIERCQGSDCTNFAHITTVGANATSYLDIGLLASTSYMYRVRAYNLAGDSGYSDPASATTQTAPALPAAPSNLTAKAISSSQINLSWTDNSNNETGFRIERCKGATCTNFSQIATVGANVTAFSNTKLSRNTTYRYRVRAYNGAGDSANSNIASATTPRR